MRCLGDWLLAAALGAVLGLVAIGWVVEGGRAAPAAVDPSPGAAPVDIKRLSPAPTEKPCPDRRGLVQRAAEPDGVRAGNPVPDASHIACGPARVPAGAISQIDAESHPASQRRSP